MALMFVLITAVAAGCSGGIDAARKASQENNAAVSNGQKVVPPEEIPALIGKVKDIVGNEVIVFKGELPQNQGAPTRSPVRLSQNQANQGDQNRRMGIKFTEETETFLIPVGTPVVTMQRGTREVTQVGLTEIKKDTVLRVWKKGDTVSFVQVTGTNMPRGSGQGADGNRQGAGTGAGIGGGIPPGMGDGPPAMGGNR